MNLIKRTAALLLALSLALAVFSSCGKAADSGKTDGTLSADGIAEETTEAETGILDYLPSMDFGGNTFTILQREGYDYEFKSEEQTGDLIEDAIYERNNLVKDLYNVKIKTIEKPYTWGGGDTFNKELVSSIMAGDSDFDIVAGYAAMILGAIQKGLFINWYDVPNVNVDNPWWSPQIADSLTINNKMFAMSGDISLSLWECMECIYYNQKIAENYNSGDFYKIVKDNAWTFDIMNTAASQVYGDLNGNGEFDPADMHGFIAVHSTPIDAFLPAFDIQVVKRGDDGWLHFAINSDRTVGALEKLASMFFGGGQYAFMTATENLEVIFKEDRSLFYAGDLRLSARLRDMETNYGILPYPKYDENQEKYYSSSTDGFSVILFPSTVKDIESAGFITEALCAASSGIVVPAYYDVALKDKYNRDAQSAEMLDIIRSVLVFDYGYLNSFALDGAGHIFVELARRGKTDFASDYAKKEKALEKKLELMMEAYAD
ncbi:MAG: hypothetical protein ACOX4O_02050 [Eubacteriales bacterium]